MGVTEQVAGEAPETPPGGPFVSVRVSVTDDDGTRRTDLTLRGERGLAVGDGGTFDFPAADTWTVVRRLLPRLAPLRSRPARTGLVATTPPSELAGLADQARGFVAIVVAIGDDSRPDADQSDQSDQGQSDNGAVVALRTWLATADALYSVAPDDGAPTRMSTGAVAEHLIWDLTGALQLLAARAPDEREAS